MSTRRASTSSSLNYSPPGTSSGLGSSTDDDALLDFRNVFPQEVSKFPYGKSRNARINRNRGSLGGKLFFDMLITDHVPEIENSSSPPHRPPPPPKLSSANPAL